MKIKDVIVYALTTSHRDLKKNSRIDWSNLLYPSHLYKELNPKQKKQPKTKNTTSSFSQLFLEIHTEDDIIGRYGPIESWQASIILDSLKPLLIGKDPLATETLHNLMMCINRHGRSGYFMPALSAVDLALWDLKGNFFNQPVYRLCGGATRKTIPAYASMLGYSTNPQKASAKAKDLMKEGYQAQKWFFRYGPSDGDTGIKKNIELAQSLRQAVGPSYQLMFDASRSWGVSYTMEMLKQLEPFSPYFVEEPFFSDQLEHHRRIKSHTQIPIASGEHIYTRWQAFELLQSNAIDILQTDPDWVGGITEQLKICALCSAYGIPLIAHGHAMHPPAHLAFCQSPELIPLIEHLVLLEKEKQFFIRHKITPKNGKIKIENFPGLGMEIDEEKVSKKQIWTQNTSK